MLSCLIVQTHTSSIYINISYLTQFIFILVASLCLPKINLFKFNFSSCYLTRNWSFKSLYTLTKIIDLIYTNLSFNKFNRIEDKKVKLFRFTNKNLEILQNKKKSDFWILNLFKFWTLLVFPPICLMVARTSHR